MQFAKKTEKEVGIYFFYSWEMVQRRTECEAIEERNSSNLLCERKGTILEILFWTEKPRYRPD